MARIVFRIPDDRLDMILELFCEATNQPLLPEEQRLPAFKKWIRQRIRVLIGERVHKKLQQKYRDEVEDIIGGIQEED